LGVKVVKAVEVAVVHNRHELIKLFIEMMRINDFIPLTYNIKFA
jgi:hypothetical protein